MKKIPFIKVRGSFNYKLFFLFTIFSFTICCSFTIYFINYQSAYLNKSLLNDGKLLGEVLAINSRLGIYSENQKLLEETIEGVINQKNVLRVSIYDFFGNLLSGRINEDFLQKKNMDMKLFQSCMELLNL